MPARRGTRERTFLDKKVFYPNSALSRTKTGQFLNFHSITKPFGQNHVKMTHKQYQPKILISDPPGGPVIFNIWFRT